MPAHRGKMVSKSLVAAAHGGWHSLLSCTHSNNGHKFSLVVERLFACLLTRPCLLFRLGTIHILRNIYFHAFGPRPPTHPHLCKHIFVLQISKTWHFSNPFPPPRSTYVIYEWSLALAAC